MHPAIARFPSERFYSGRIASGVTAAERPLLEGVPWQRRQPILFVACEGVEKRQQASAPSGGEGVRGSLGPGM
jgi:hypothetical protein